MNVIETSEISVVSHYSAKYKCFVQHIQNQSRTALINAQTLIKYKNMVQMGDGPYQYEVLDQNFHSTKDEEGRRQVVVLHQPGEECCEGERAQLKQ